MVGSVPERLSHIRYICFVWSFVVVVVVVVVAVAVAVVVLFFVQFVQFRLLAFLFVCSFAPSFICSLAFLKRKIKETR